MKTKVTPLADRILVKRLEEVESTKGGIIIPDTAKEKPQQGKVIALGTGKTGKEGKKVPFSVKKGDKIIFASYAGTEITVDNEEYLIMKEEDVLGVIQ